MSATTMKTHDLGNQPATDKGAGGNEEAGSAYKAALGQLDHIKARLRGVMTQLDEEVSNLKSARKEQRASAREIQSVRAKLRELRRLEL